MCWSVARSAGVSALLGLTLIGRSAHAAEEIAHVCFDLFRVFAGFEAALTKTFNDSMRATKALKVNDDDVIKDDILEGMTAVVTVRLAEPQFEGQTKEILGTPAARTVVRKVVAAELKNFLTSTKRAEKAQAKLLMEKVVGASKTRIAARQHKETQRRKNALESSTLPAKLADAGVTTAKIAAEDSEAVTPVTSRSEVDRPTRPFIASCI